MMGKLLADDFFNCVCNIIRYMVYINVSNCCKADRKFEPHKTKLASLQGIKNSNPQLCIFVYFDILGLPAEREKIC